MVELLPKVELPADGAIVSTPRFATGAATAVHATELSAVQETDPTSALVESNVVTISGIVDVSRQLLDRSQPGIDEALTAELANAAASSLDDELINGTNAAGRLNGLLNAAGVSVTYDERTSKLPAASGGGRATGHPPAAPRPRRSVSPKKLLGGHVFALVNVGTASRGIYWDS